MRLMTPALLLLLAAVPCAASTRSASHPHRCHRLHSPRTTPRTLRSSPVLGLASWYGKREQGHRMANGDRFDRFKFTAASRTLAFGTRLRVVNPKNGKSVLVTITDRGPVLRSRILDLAQAAAKAIHCPGVCRVAYTIIP